MAAANRTIRVLRNEVGNCVHFIGSSLPTYWNGCLSAIIDPKDSNKIHIKNNVSSTEESPQYEFYGINFKMFVDAEGFQFADAITCAQYITQAANSVPENGIVLFPPDTSYMNPPMDDPSDDPMDDPSDDSTKP